MNAGATPERISELIDQMTDRLNKAELTLNRHGFTQDERGDWKAPGMPNWAGALELRDYLRVHFPDIEASKGSLNQKATQALIEADRRRVEAASEWIKSSLPSLKMKSLHLAAAPEEVREVLLESEERLAETMLERDALREHIAATEKPAVPDSSTLPKTPSIIKAIWPDPSQVNFTLDRRDPFSTEVRHDSLKRRSDDD